MAYPAIRTLFLVVDLNSPNSKSPIDESRLLILIIGSKIVFLVLVVGEMLGETSRVSMSLSRKEGKV